MSPQRLAGLVALALGVYLAFAQASGTMTYVQRGADLGDAVSGEVILIGGSALLAALAGALLAAGHRVGRWVGLLALVLNGVILFLTLQLGPGRPVWIAGAVLEIALLAGVVLAIIRPKNA